MDRTPPLVAALLVLCVVSPLVAGVAGGANDTTSAATETTPEEASVLDFYINDVRLETERAVPGEEVGVVATVENRANVSGTFDFQVRVGEEIVASRSVELDGGEERDIRVTFTTGEPRNYVVFVNGVYGGLLRVVDPDPPTLFGVSIPLLASVVGWSGFVLGGASVVAATVLTVVFASAWLLGRETPWPVETSHVRWLWIGGGVFLLLGATASGSPAEGALLGIWVVVGYGFLSFVELVYRSGV